VDETGGQIAVFGRLGSRPFTRPEMEQFFIDWRGDPYKVTNTPTSAGWTPLPGRSLPPAMTTAAR
jgi:hypothetical protein